MALADAYKLTSSSPTRTVPSTSKRLRMVPVDESVFTSSSSSSSAAAAAEAVASSVPSTFVYTPPEVGPEIWAGSVIAVLPFIWASYKFLNRIRIQKECLVCKGSGLVKVSQSGIALSRLRKCWSCGGILPWLGWKMFWFSTLFDVGNGGVLLQPADNYEETQERIRRGEVDYGTVTADDAAEKSS